MSLTQKIIELPNEKGPEMEASDPLNRYEQRITDTLTIAEEPFTYKTASMTHGYIMLQRAAEELFFNDMDSFILLTQIAFRALRKDSKYNKHKLKVGQALIGDYQSIGLSEKRYRTAKHRLEKVYKFVAFKGTNKGTIATILSSEVYDINPDSKGEQEGGTRASQGRTEGGQRATNKEVISKKEKEIRNTYAQTAAPLRTKDPLSFSFEEKKFIGITDADLESWRIAYPEIDLWKEITKAQNWMLGNPSKAKKLWRKFLVGWLQRSSDSAMNKSAALSQKQEANEIFAWEKINRDKFFEWKKKDPEVLKHMECKIGYVVNNRNNNDLSLKMKPEAFLAAFCGVAGVKFNGNV